MAFPKESQCSHSVFASLFAVLCMISLGMFSGCSSAEPEEGCGQHCLETASFVIQWTESETALPGVRIAHRDSPERLIFETLAGADWVRVAHGEETVSESGGSFLFEDDRVEECSQPVLDGISATDGSLRLEVSFSDCNAQVVGEFSEKSTTQIGLEISVVEGPYNRILLEQDGSGVTSYLGFGNQYNRLNMIGYKIPVWCQEQGHGRGLEPLSSTLDSISPGSSGDWHTSYTCVPFYMTNTNRGLVLENTEYLVFDFESEGKAAVEVYSGSLKARILNGDDPAGLVESLTEYTGRMASLPEWTQKGAIVRSHGGSGHARDVLDELLEVDCPVAGLWIEDWAGSRDTFTGTRMWWNWVLDETLYPDWAELVPELLEKNVRVLIYFNPFLVDAAEKPGVQRNLFEEAMDGGYLVKNTEEETVYIESGGFQAGMVDLTNSSAKEWLTALMHEQIGYGVSGWMADFAEALPYDSVLSSGVSASAYHNEYPYDWARLNREAVQAAGVDDEFLFFSRSGNARSPGVARLFWIGDQLVTWDAYDGLGTVVPALLSSGLSGYSLQHSDTGGWLSIQLEEVFPNLEGVDCARSEELFLRWLELNAFSPLLRLHTTNQPEANHQYNSTPESLAAFARFTKIFAAMASYRASLMEEAQSRGLPLVRHPILHYPEDPEAWGLMQQFLLGPDLMVAPVIEEGATTVEIYLPTGSWTHLFTGEVLDQSLGGGWSVVEAPMGTPAVFYRSDSAAGQAIADSLEAEGLR